MKRELTRKRLNNLCSNKKKIDLGHDKKPCQSIKAQFMKYSRIILSKSRKKDSIKYDRKLRLRNKKISKN